VDKFEDIRKYIDTLIAMKEASDFYNPNCPDQAFTTLYTLRDRINVAIEFYKKYPTEIKH